MDKKHLVIIGAGIGGYTAALKGAAGGLRVTLIEKDVLGGTCLNYGCIPMKVFLHKVQLLAETERNMASGIFEGHISMDMKKVQEEKADVIGELTYGLRHKMKKAGVRMIQGAASVASLKDEIVVEVLKSDGSTEAVTGDGLIVATGAHTEVPEQFRRFSSDDVWTTKELLELDEIPKSAVVIGGGVAGLEAGAFLTGAGCIVNIIEMNSHILEGFDPDISDELIGQLEDQGIVFYLHTAVNSVEKIEEGFLLSIHSDGQEAVLEAEKIIICTGRNATIHEIGLEVAGVRVDSGKITVDDHQETNIPGVYAVGDCASGPMLAHGAAEEARRAVDHILGNESGRLQAMPVFLYTMPAVASVGMTSVEAKARGFRPVESCAHFYANGMARILRRTDGFVKLVADADSGRILGFHMIGPYAEEILGTGTVFVAAGLTAKSLLEAVYPHPTVVEAVREALEGL